MKKIKIKLVLIIKINYNGYINEWRNDVTG